MEGEALAVAWSLEQTRYFTLGCKDLTVMTDHKPLLGLFKNSSLEDITNPRLFALKQRTLPWNFMVTHVPGRDNKFPDATSRFPSTLEDVADPPISEVLCNILGEDSDEDDVDELILAASEDEHVRAIT